jgi:hypothetical protein
VPTVQVQQVLHGYDRGHRELASSVSLSPDSKHAMLVLSDLSGPRATKGFDSYLTGYPVPGSDLYALARTWLAPEMPRPGCVWTHSLLMEQKAVTALGIGSLTELFRRPERSELHLFERPLEVEAGGPTSASKNGGTAKLANLIRVTYGQSAHACVIADGSQDLEDLVATIWDHQWPGVKSHFAFSTGSFAPRFLEGSPFDLQVVPRQLVPLWPWEIDEVGHQPSEDWERFALEDMQGPDRLRVLLSLIGSTSRMDLVPVASALARAAQASDAREAALALAAALELGLAPIRSQAVARILEDDALWPKTSVAARVLAAILVSGGIQPTQKVRQVLRDCAARATRASRVDGWGIARKAMTLSESDRIGQEILEGVSFSLSPQDVLTRKDADKELVLRLVGINPRLAASPHLWRGPGEIRRSLFEAVSSGCTRDKSSLREVLLAVVASRSPEAIAEAYAGWKEQLIQALLESLEREKIDTSWPDETWAILGDNESAVVKWLLRERRNRPDLYRVAAISLGPSAVQQLCQPIEPWLSLEGIGLREAAFMLAISLQTPDPAGRVLIKRVFGNLNSAAGRGTLPDPAWRLLETYLPSLGFKNWDRCERLRRCVAATFIAHRWPLADLLDLADVSTTQRQLLRSLRHIPGGKQYVNGAKKTPHTPPST